MFVVERFKTIYERRYSMNNDEKILLTIYEGLNELNTLNITRARQLSNQKQASLYARLVEATEVVENAYVPSKNVGQKYRFLEKAYCLMYILEQCLGKEVESTGKTVEIEVVNEIIE